MILGGLAGFIGGIVSALAGYGQNAAVVGGALGYIAGLVWSPFVVRMMLGKKYGDFRLALIPVDIADDYPDR
jgi:hypothetical protein